MDYKNLVDSFAQIAAVISLDLSGTKNSEIYKKIDEIETHVNKYIENMKSMVMGQTYVNIVRTCEYWLERGWVEQDDIRDLEHYLYDPYREWGGNGTAERLFIEVCA